MTSGKVKTRRRYDAQFKAQVLAECDAPGASVAKVAMSHGINDNVVHRWRQLAREAGGVATPVATAFVPVALPAPAKACSRADVRVELRRGAITVAITWPSTALAELADFTRELLR
jgi:transposase